MGLNTEGKLIFDPIEKNDLIESIVKYVDSRKDEFKSKGPRQVEFGTSRGLLSPSVIDPNDPKSSGWTYLINKKSSQKKKIIDAMEPLAEFRGMQDPFSPLEFDREAYGDRWDEWIRDEYDILSQTGTKPRYIMIVGSPNDIPFHFQAELDIGANVGRVDFDSIDDLTTYVQKVIRIEENIVTNGEATFFATNGGIQDPTYYSHNFMVNPLKKFVSDRMHRRVTEIVDRNATKKNLLENLKNSKSSLVYTASHGMGSPSSDETEQKRITGGICCQREIGKNDLEDWLLTADDIPKETPFLEGSIVFQFACLGFGSPKMSDLNHWFPEEWEFQEQIAHSDFTAALPKKLLANPHGPTAYIGHLDNALLHGFDDPNDPGAIDSGSPRIAPFLTCVEKILGAHTVSEALNDMNAKYTKQAATIMRLNDQLQRENIEYWEYAAQLSDAFLTGVDARNFLLMGDPACAAKINQH